jgi:ribosomal protein S18 acetylase RimI-like enzyme
MSTLHVRVAREDDIGAVLDLWHRAEAPPSPTDGEEGLRTLIRKDPEALLLAETNAEVVGSLIVGWDGWRGNLYRLAVLPAHRRSGVARRLVREGLKRLQASGAVRINALVIGADPRATGFWRAAGFVHDARMARFRTGGTPSSGSSQGGAPDSRSPERA